MVVADPPRASLPTLADASFDGVDFIDFGAGEGFSLVSAERRFGARGIGIDRNEAKVGRAQAAGRNVVLGSILDVPRTVRVPFVTMDNVLEHLPDHETVKAVLGIAADIATDFIYIRHPTFDDEAYLNALGFKQFWTDWGGHPSHLLLIDIVRMLRELGLGLVEFEFVGEANSSGDDTILPLSAPRDSFHYDLALHGDKPTIELARPTHYAIDLIVPARPRSNGVALVYATDSRVPKDHPRFEAAPWLAPGPAPAELLERCRRLEARRALRLANAFGALARSRTPRQVLRALKALGKALRKVG